MCRSRARGSVLLLVVWAIALLGILAAGLGSRVGFALSLTERLDQQLQARSAALGAVHVAIQALKNDPSQQYDTQHERWMDNAEVFSEWKLGNVSASVQPPQSDSTGRQVYGLVDEERHLSLNTAPGDALRRLFQFEGGLKPLEAQAIADAIEDWRDADNEKRLDGAENFEYLDLDPPYECKNRPFEMLEELQLIRGMTPDMYKRVAPYLTVYGSGKLNINTAPAPVLRALGLSELGIKGLIAYRAGEDDFEGTSDDRPITSLNAITTELGSYVPAEDLTRLAKLTSEKLLSVGSKTAHGIVTAKVQDGRYPVIIECIGTGEGQIQFWAER